MPASSPHHLYHYSTYGEEDEVRPAERPRVILGAGPNRIGQDRVRLPCPRRVRARRGGVRGRDGNSNPETVSTDYATSARLYFEPLSAEDVLAVCEAERPVGVLCQMGGQTPLRLAHDLEAAGWTVLGTLPDAIDLAEDRGRFARLLQELEIPARRRGGLTAPNRPGRSPS